MATFNKKTKNNNDVDKKPRVFFTCHPDDFEKYFEKICEDIFKTHDCAVYYTEDIPYIHYDDCICHICLQEILKRDFDTICCMILCHSQKQMKIQNIIKQEKSILPNV